MKSAETTYTKRKATRLSFYVIFLCLIVSCLGSCTTYYCKMFAFAGSIRYPGFSFVNQDIKIGLSIDAQPTDESSYRDSSYCTYFYVTRPPDDDCSARVQEILESIELDSAAILIGDITVLPANVSIDRDGWCSIRWDFAPIVIPESIDTIHVTLGLQYTYRELTQRIDTTVTMTRLMGKAKDLPSY